MENNAEIGLEDRKLAAGKRLVEDYGEEEIRLYWPETARILEGLKLLAFRSPINLGDRNNDKDG